MYPPEEVLRPHRPSDNATILAWSHSAVVRLTGKRLGRLRLCLGLIPTVAPGSTAKLPIESLIFGRWLVLREHVHNFTVAGVCDSLRLGVLLRASSVLRAALTSGNAGQERVGSLSGHWGFSDLGAF